MKKTQGTDAVMDGKLTGATDGTDHFYFLCPKCGTDTILRLLNYEMVNDEAGNKYDQDLRSNAKRSFVIRIEAYCEQCKFRDLFNIGNIGWQGGSLAEASNKKANKAEMATPRKPSD